MSSIIKALEWRYAAKKFSGETVPDDKIRVLKRSVNLTATSFGLQPFRMMIVTDEATKQKLREAGYDQPQFTTASHVFVFAAKLDMTPEYVDAFIEMMAQQRGIPVDAISGYGEYIKGSVTSKDVDFLRSWNKRQAYIALGSLLAAAGEIEVDSCPMEGFDAVKFDEILGLPGKGLTACVVCPVGYRAADDETQNYKKVRLPLEEMFLSGK